MLTVTLSTIFGYYIVQLLVYGLPLLAAIYRSEQISPAPMESNDQAPLICVVLPCRNGGRNVSGLIECLRNQDYPRDRYRILVLADNCSDNSATIARDLGTEVYERANSSIRTKGAALNELLRNKLQHEKFDVLTILDIDCRVGPDFLRQVAASSPRSAILIQSALESGNSEDTSLTRIGDAVQAMVRVQQQGRAVLGLSALMIGSAISLTRDSLNQLNWYLGTGQRLTEDVELGLRCCLLDIPIVYAEAQRVWIDLPDTAKSIRLQRRRWSAGPFELLMVYGWPLTATLLRGSRLSLDALLSVVLSAAFAPLFACWGIWSLSLNLLALRIHALSFWGRLSVVLWILHAVYYVVCLRTEVIRLTWRDAGSLLVYFWMRFVAVMEGLMLALHVGTGERWIPTAPPQRKESSATMGRE